VKVALAHSAPPKIQMRPTTTLLAVFSLIVLVPAALATTHRAPAKPIHASRHKLEVKGRHRKTATPPHAVKAAKAAKPSPAPAPEPHVTHNRKVHLAPDSTPTGTSSSRKATSADFLNASAPSPKSDHPPAIAEASLPLIVPVLYERGHLIMPPPLKGSHEILLRQNENANRDGLERIQDEADIQRMLRARTLVPLPVGSGLQVDERLPLDRRYTRPWAARFLADLSRAHQARFHTPLQVNSAVRTVDFQLKLIRTNGNAAPAEGETASPHLTGQALDIAKKELTPVEIAWMRSYLAVLIQQGKIDVEEEFQQACFHISVYRKYVPVPHGPAAKEIAVADREPHKTLAIDMHTTAALPAPIVRTAAEQ
jgi:hypothetical protein